jgi:hypothetical protein
MFHQKKLHKLVVNIITTSKIIPWHEFYCCCWIALGFLKKTLGGKYTQHGLWCLILMIFCFCDRDNNVNTVFEYHSEFFSNRCVGLILYRQRYRFLNFHTTYAGECQVIYTSRKNHCVTLTIVLVSMNNTCYVRFVFVRNEVVCGK